MNMRYLYYTVRKWADERLTYIACGLTAIAIVLWSWWVISHMNTWANTINQYILQTDRRLEVIEQQLLELEVLDRHQAVERNV